MSSGRDALLLGYFGSGFVSLNGHKHTEAHQGAPCGWYKSATKRPKEYMQPCVTAGVQVELYGAYVVPRSFEQEFIPEEATLITTLGFRAGIRLRITSFFTYDDSIWCERVEVLECPEGVTPSISFRVSKPFLSERLSFTRASSVSFSDDGDGKIGVGYTLGDFKGHGALIADRPFDRVKISEGKFDDQCYAEGSYDCVKAGFRATRVMFLLDESESHTTCDKLLEKACRGFDMLYTEHKALYEKYFSTADIKTGDEKLDYEFKLSRYLIKAHQHPESGIVTLGMLPNHWLGAASCSWDEEFAHEAQLTTGNFAESQHFTKQYKRQAPEGYRILSERGIPGLSFSGWNTLAGEFCGHRPIEEWITTFKPMFAAYSVLSIYSEWKYDPDFDAAEYRKICEDVITFVLYTLVKRGEDGLYYLTDVKDGMETGVMVSVDTSTTLFFARAFMAVGEMYGIREYSQIGKSMVETLEGNRRPDGLLASARGSAYTASHIEFYRYTHKLGLTDPALLPKALAELETPWGFDSQISTEETRHWPWYDSWAARDFTVAKMPSLAAKRIRHLTYGSSSLGAMPEQIRLDGMGIGYYYTSPHALLVSAVCEAFAVMGDGELLICYGFDEEFPDVSARDVHVEGGLSVSVKITGGTLSSLAVKNDTGMDIRQKISINPLIKSNGVPEYITVPRGGSVTVI